MATAAKEHNRYGILSAAFVVMFFVASIALFSVFLTPLSEQHGWSKTDVSLSYSIFQTVMAVTGIFSGRISDRFGPRKVMIVGGLVFGSGWFLTGMATSIPMLYLCHGVIAGMGNGLVYNPTLTTAQRWFPDIRGKASGILLAAAAIGPATLSPIASFLSSTFGVSTALKILGVTFWITITLGSLFVSPVPEGYRPKGWNPPTPATSADNAEDDGFDWKAMLSSPRFYVLLLVYAAAATAGTMLVGALSSIAQYQVGQVGAMTAAAFGAMVVSINTLSNFVGRLAFGALLVIYPPLTGETFGTKHLGINYGIMFLGYALGAWIGPRIATSLFDETVGYRNAFHAAAMITLIGLAVVLLLVTKVRKTGTMMPKRK
ncbi:OFA family MFS transporter [Bifidobacterium dentium]|uniref:OFA family MFS transporter n=1 Tax=Bifidobacterium dentium TaxID=1689 RepID=UPI003D181D79